MSRATSRPATPFRALLGAALLLAGVGGCQTREAPAGAAAAGTAGAPATDALATSQLDQDVRLLRAAILTDPELFRSIWTPAGDSTGRIIEDGELLWSPTRQRGIARIVGLPVNDSTRWQYQLWIIDSAANAAPVAAALFNMVPGQPDRLVPIRPRTTIGHAVSFEITVEPSGGSPAPTRERTAVRAR